MKKTFLILIFFIIQINFVSANNNIAFVDMDKIINSTKAGSSILKQLNKINDKISKNFKKEQENIKKNENKLLSQKNILSKSDFDINYNKLRKEIEEYNKKRQKIINDFNKQKISNTNQFLLMINEIMAKYSDSNSISLIFQKKNLVIAKTELDITDEIIKIIDKNIKEFKIK